jgi:hypothetical protein
MKHIILFTALLLALSSGATAQKLTISEAIPLRSDLAFDILGEMGGHTLFFRNRNASFEIQALDQNLQEAWLRKIELDRRLPRILDVVPGDEKFTVIYQYKDNANTILKAHQYGPGAELQDSTDIINLGTLFFTPNFSVVRSEDRSKSLIYYTEKQDLIKAVCFDHNRMEMLWQAAIQPMDFNFFQDFQQAIVNNNGNMYLVIERNNFRTKRETHHFEILFYKGATSLLRKTTVPMSDLLTFDTRFTYDHLNGSLIACGLFSDKNLGRADGYFYLKVNPALQGGFMFNAQPFDDAFLTNLLGKKADKAKGMPEAEVRDLVLRLDGGVLLIGERTRLFQRNAAATNQGFYDPTVGFAVDFYYDELFVISIHPDGREHWSTVLHKKQYSQDDDGVYSSFFLLRTASSLRFLFNDEIKYENTVSEYVLKGNGRFKRKSLLSTENLRLRLRFRDAVQINANTVIIPSERRNRLKLVRLEYN